MPEKRRKTENATNPAQHQRGEKLFLQRIGCQKKILTWRCHLRLKCLYSRTHMGNVGSYGLCPDHDEKTHEGYEMTSIFFAEIPLSG